MIAPFAGEDVHLLATVSTEREPGPQQSDIGTLITSCRFFLINSQPVIRLLPRLRTHQRRAGTRRERHGSLRWHRALDGAHDTGVRVSSAFLHCMPTIGLRFTFVRRIADNAANGLAAPLARHMELAVPSEL
jgi:hypothetical protein